MRKTNECNTIDFRKAGKYKGRQWNELEKTKDKCKGKIRKFCSVNGDCSEVKNKNLFIDGKRVYKWKGWGMGAGTNYEMGKGKYKTSIGWLDEVRMKDKKEMLVPFKIQDRTKIHKRGY